MRKKTGLVLILMVIAAGVALLLIYPGLLRRESRQPEVPLPNEEEKVERVTLYFPNQEYIQTGREDIAKLKAVDREVKIREDNLLEAVLQELRRPPGGEELTTALRDDLEVLGAWSKERIAYVNFSSQNLYGGSLQETLLVDQLVKTLTSLPGIDKVQFLIDGEKRETLMGHLSIDEPLSGDNL
jgi:spore germination protein GerM